MDANTTQILVAILGTTGAASFLGIIATGAVKYFNGTAGRERIRNVGLKEQRDLAWRRENESDARLDIEAQNGRIISEYASGLRRDLIELGVPEDKLRKWPKLKQLPKESETT